MNQVRILQKLHAMGLNAEQSFTAIHAVQEDVVASIMFKIWEFREQRASKIGHPYAAMVQLMGHLRDYRYGGDRGTPQGMKVCYIAHPIGGDVEENLADLRRIVAIINHSYGNVVPFVPYYVDCVILDDNDPKDRERGIKNDHFLLGSGIIDEIWLTGPHLSAGMCAKKLLGDHLGIPIVDKIGQL